MLSLRFLAPALALTVGLLTAGPRFDKRYSQVPLRFEPNVGQADPAAAYVARGAGFRMLLTGDQAVLAADTGAPLRMRLEDARSGRPLGPAATPEDRLPSVSNYYFGNDPTLWHANVPNYGRVKFERVYPGIDVVYYGNAQGLEYDLIVAPGADPARIRWAYSGADSIRLDSAGDLVFTLHGREIRQGKPTIYQEVAGRRREVRGEYQLAQGEVRLALGEYDDTETLVIDPPVLVYSTYLGGSGTEDGNGAAIAVDSFGAAYITGNTTGGFPTLNAHQSAAGNATNNAFVAKFSASGTLVYSTYLSGSAESDGSGIAVDSNGDAYVTGRTAGGNFPLLNPQQAAYGGGTFDGFVTILSPSGGLNYSTYLGGSGDDEGAAIAVDSSNNIYVTGYTSGSFPTLNAAQGTYGGGSYDAFAVKLNNLGALVYSTYLGGSGEDLAYGIAVDASGAYIAGATASTNFPTLNPLQAVYGGGAYDAFVVKLSGTGVRQYATFLGGSAADIGIGIAVDGSGDVYITGETAGGFPTQNAAQATYGGGVSDAFVTEINPFGSSLLYSTYLGGAGTDVGYAIALDSTGAAYITGQTSGSFPVQNALQSTYGGGNYDGFVAELSPSGGVVYATYLGGPGTEAAIGIGVDSTGAAYVTGGAGTGFPTLNAYQPTFGGGSSDAFVAKISPAATLATSGINGIFPDTAVAGGAGFTLSISGDGFKSPIAVSWNGTALEVTFANATYLTAMVPASLIASVGVAQVTVTNPGESASNAAIFNIVASPVVPNLSVIPSASQTCSSGAFVQQLFIAGSGFQSGITFYWNGTPLGGFTGGFPFVNVPATLLQTSGSASITASNGGAMSPGFSVTFPPPISLTNLNPSSVAAGSGSVTLTATGMNFAPGYSITTDCNYGPIDFGLTQQLTGTVQLQLIIPAVELSTAGTYYLFVGNNSFGSNSLPFTVTAPGGLTISAPASLPTGEVGVLYNTAITASGGAPPYAFSATGLPTGLSIGGTGTITGTPTATFNGSVTIKVTDSNSTVASKSYALTISPNVSIGCSSFAFNVNVGGAPPTSQPCSITSVPSGQNVSAVASTLSGGNWLSASLSSGTTPDTLTIFANILGLPAATYNGNVTLTVGGFTFPSLPVTLTVNPSGPVTFTLTPSSASPTAAASTGTTALTLSPAGSNAAWTTAATAAWLHITSPAGGAGSGAATIGYSVDANTGVARTGTFTVSSGGDVVATFTLNQAAVNCSALSVSPTSFTFGSGGGTGVLTFNTAPCPWTASVSGSDPALISGLPASGNTGTSLTQTFSVSSGTVAASASITIGTTPPTTVTVTRNAPVCTYTITTPGAIGTTQSFLSPSNTGSVNVTAPAGCQWTAASNSSFLGVTGVTSSGACSPAAANCGTGPGSVSYSVAANPAQTGQPSRTGTLTVAGITYTIVQDPQGPQGYGCSVSTPTPYILRGEGIAELAPDFVFTCSGFSLGNVTGDVLITLNTAMTNHTLNADPAGQTTDALLLMDQAVDQPNCSNTFTGAVYRGVIAGPQAVRFHGVSLAPEQGDFCHVFRITNVRMDASHLIAVTGSGLAPTETVSILSTSQFFVSGATQTVGFAEPGSSFKLGSSGPAPIGQSQPITFTEGFATAYRIRLVPGQDPSTAGTVYNSESGYVNSAVLGSDTGFATNATRLVARLANIPAGTSVYASVAQTSGSANAQLVSADTNGTGGSPMQSSTQVPGYQQVALVNGAGTATWEITASNPDAIDSLTFDLLIGNPSLTLTSSCAAGTTPSICGELGPQVVVSAPSNTAPVPRFVNPTVPTAQLAKLSLTSTGAILTPPGTAGHSGLAGATMAQTMAPAVRRASAASSLTPLQQTPPQQTVGGTLSASLLLASDPTLPPVTNASVGVTLPPTYTITSCNVAGATCVLGGSQMPNQVSVNYPTYDPGQSSSINLTADTTDTSDTAAEIDASATSDSGNSLPGFSQTVPVSPGATVALAFAGPSMVGAGLQISYSVQLTNTGSGDKVIGDPLTVTITPDPALDASVVCAPFAPTNGNWSCMCPAPGTTLVCTDTSLVPAKGGSTSFTVNAIVPQGQGSAVSSSATLTFGGHVSAPTAVSTPIGGAPAAVMVLSPGQGATGVSTSATLTWGAVTGATSYNVNFGTTNPPPQVTSTSGTSYSPTMSPGTTYYWSVTAVNSFGSTPSAVWFFTTVSPAGCSFALAPGSASLPATGTSTVEACPNNSGQPNCGVIPDVPRTFTVTPSAACGAWTATSSNPEFLQIASGATGSGVGIVGFTLLNNTHSGQQSYSILVASGTGSATYSVTEAGSGDNQTYREIYALYEQLLGRDPDPAGFAFWSGSGTAGLGQMADSFLTSPEAFNSDFAVMTAYQAATDVPPTYAQFAAAVTSIRAGTQTVPGLFNALIGGGYTTTTLYKNLLNRAPTGADSSCTSMTLVNCFQAIVGFPSNTTPVGAANNEFQSTGTYHTAADHTNGLYVQMIYYVTLSRDPDAGGLSFWTGVANGGGPGVLFQGSAGYSTRIQILGPGTPNQGFIGSPEFQGLFVN